MVSISQNDIAGHDIRPVCQRIWADLALHGVHPCSLESGLVHTLWDSESLHTLGRALNCCWKLRAGGHYSHVTHYAPLSAILCYELLAIGNINYSYLLSACWLWTRCLNLKSLWKRNNVVLSFPHYPAYIDWSGRGRWLPIQHSSWGPLLFKPIVYLLGFQKQEQGCAG